MRNNPLTAGLPPIHPGAVLREDILSEMSQSKTEIASLLGVSRQTLYDILQERQPVTVSMALRLAKLFGNSPEMWVDLQSAYDLKVKSMEMADELEQIPTLNVA